MSIKTMKTMKVQPKPVTLRVSPYEYSLMETQARQQGVRSVEAWAKPSLGTIAESQEALRELKRRREAAKIHEQGDDKGGGGSRP